MIVRIGIIVVIIGIIKVLHSLFLSVRIKRNKK